MSTRVLHGIDDVKFSRHSFIWGILLHMENILYGVTFDVFKIVQTIDEHDPNFTFLKDNTLTIMRLFHSGVSISIRRYGFRNLRSCWNYPRVCHYKKNTQKYVYVENTVLSTKYLKLNWYQFTQRFIKHYHAQWTFRYLNCIQIFISIQIPSYRWCSFIFSFTYKLYCCTRSSDVKHWIVPKI